MTEESEEAKIERWKKPTIIGEIAQEHVDMWNGCKDAAKAEAFNQHILRSLTKTTASALMEGSNGKTPEGATRFVDDALQDSDMPRSAKYALSIPKARPDLGWSQINREDAAWALFRNIVKLKMKDRNLKIQWASAIECMINTEDQSDQMKDTQILALLDMMMPEKKNDCTDVYASSEEETDMGEERIQTGPLRVQIHMCVDKLDEVRESGTNGEESISQKIMFETVDEEFEGVMDDERVWESIPKEVRGEPWTRRIYQFNDEHDAKLFFERVKEKLRQINSNIGEDQEIKGHECVMLPLYAFCRHTISGEPRCISGYRWQRWGLCAR